MNLRAAFPILSLALSCSTSAQRIPGDLFLERYDLESWEFDIDHDADGLTTREEYHLGTNPLVPNGTVALDILDEHPAKVLLWDSKPGAVYQPYSSETLSDFTILGSALVADGSPIELEMPQDGERRFFRLDALAPGDADGDGLSSVDEGLLGTNPNNDDTDGDLRKDGDEVFISLSDPLVFDAPGGTIRGRVFNDADNNGDLASDTPLGGATVYLDANFNGRLDEGERTAKTDGSGRYEFLNVKPGLHHVRQNLPAPNVQTFPVEGVAPSFDLLPDEVFEYVHAADGVGDFDEPYGENASENPLLWNDVEATGLNAEPVDPAVVLKPLGVRARVPGILTFGGSEFVSLPTGASMTLRFDEVIIDGAGPDLLIHSIEITGGTPEAAEIFVGSSPGTLVSVGTFSQSLGTIAIDLGEFGITAPVQYVKILSENNGGGWQGFELVGAECIHIARPDPGVHAVTVTAQEVFEDRDFGRYFRDLPPTLVLSAGGSLRVGETANVRATAFDDIGVATLAATANGQPLNLDADGFARIPLADPGKLYLAASATDTGGQTTEKTLEVYVLNADGSLPFDPGGAGQGFTVANAPRTKILTPGPGFVSDADVPLVAEIVGDPAATSWTVEYAPVDLVDPYDLAAEDNDYIELATGTGNVFSTPVATLPLGSLADGIYFVRLSAMNSATRTAYFGQVVAKNVDEADLRPVVTIDSPSSGSDVMVSIDITGTITSARPLTEWYVEYARRDLVDLNNLAAPSSAWKRISEGTGTIDTSAVLASFDATTLKNNDYVARVVANNDIGLGWAEPIILQVCGEAKFGRNRLEFTDVSINLAGFPLQFKRVYDSLQSDESGDLGFGWSFELQDADIRETVPNTGVGGLFGSTPFRDGTRVYITAPTGERLGFTFKPEVGAISAFGAVYKATFVPDPGVYHTLEIPEGDRAFLELNPDGTVALYFFSFPYNPSTYVLTDPEQRRYTYNEDKGFLKAEDPNGNSITLNPGGIRHSSGGNITFERDAEERITAVIAPGGDRWTYTYDAAGDLVSSTDPEGRTTTYAYRTAPAHYLETIADPLGRIPFRYEYDPEDGRLVAIIDDQGNRREQEWDPAGFTGTVTSARGFATDLVYDARGNVTRVTDPEDNVTTYTYDDPDNPDKETAITDPAGNTWTYRYDAMGNITRLAPPVTGPGAGNGIILASYDAFGNPLSVRGFDGRTSIYEYDNRGNLTRQRNADGPHFDVEYHSSGRPARVIESNSYATSFTFDEKGMISGITDPLGFDVGIATDDAGLVGGITDHEGNSTTFAYDSRGLITSQEDAAGDTTATVENIDGSFTTTDRNGLTETVTLDANGFPTATILPGGGTLTTAYDAEQNLESLTDPLGNETTFTYDFGNRPTGETRPGVGTFEREYNSLGLLSAVVLPSGKRRTFEYDAKRNLVRENWLAPDDSVVRTIDYSYSIAGPLQVVTDTEGATVHTIYYSGGAAQPNVVTFAYQGQEEYNINYSWDRGRATTAGPVPPSRATLRRGFTQLNSIGATYIAGRTYGLRWNSSGNFITFDRAPDGRLLTATRNFGFGLGNIQSRTRYTHHPDGGTATIRHEDADGILVHSDSAVTYTRDPGGRITAQTRAGDTATASYDAAGRLAALAHTDPAIPDETYTYDAGGNRLTSHLAPGSAIVATGNRTTSGGGFSYTYDTDGNIATRTATGSGAVATYTYDHRNRLVLAVVTGTGAATVAFEYDYLDRLISRSVNGVKTWIINDRNMPIGEFADGSSEMEKVYLYSLDRTDDFHAVKFADGTERWFLKDDLGSVRGTLDETGALATWNAGYGAFGNALGNAPPALEAGLPRYAGRFFVPELGLYENRRRFYDPLAGRFTQPDPLGFVGGDTNLYAYVANNPLLFTDPGGTSAAVSYADLISLTSYYVDNLCKLGNCVGNLWKSVVEGVVNLTPTTGSQAGSCALQFTGAAECGDGSVGAGTLSAAGVLSNAPGIPGPIGGGVAIIGAVDSCKGMDFSFIPKCLP